MLLPTLVLAVIAMPSWFRWPLFAFALLVATLELRAQTSPPNLSGVVGGGTVDLGQSVTLVVSQFSPIPNNQSYQWRFNGTDIPGANGSSYVLAAVTAANAGTFSVQVTNSAGSSVASTPLTVRALAAPVITTQPRSTVVQVGQAVSFSYAATGSYPRAHQWRKDGVDIPGATDSAYSIAVVNVADAAGYSVVVSNSQGSATSSTAALTVNAATPPVIFSTSPSNATATQGQQASLSVSLSSGSSPLTYQWFHAGVAIPGATGSQLTFNAVLLTDAGSYKVVVTNIAGTATSRDATLNVTPATPVRFTYQPGNQASYIGASADFSVVFEGSSPATIQWFKNGQPIAGATFSLYRIPVLTADDAGSYTVAVTNVAGTVTSNASTLTVNPPVPPAFKTSPASQTVNFSEYVHFTVEATGSPPLTYQWKKDGVPLGSSYVGGPSDYRDITSAGTTHSGVYTVEVTNPGGKAISGAATLVVRPPAQPTITLQPTSATLAIGQAVSMGFNYSNAGTGPLSVQWFKNGVAIQGATSSSYYFSTVSEIDAGDYWAVITGAGGTTTTGLAHISTVVQPPFYRYGWSSLYDVTVPLGWVAGQYGGGPNLGYPDGSPPVSFQWYHDGVAMPGATGYYVPISGLTPADTGSYHAVISNAGGVIASPPIQLYVEKISPVPWLDAAQVGDVVYFLANSPARIERYDLAGQRWLPTVTLSSGTAPTAFMPATEGVYIAYGRAIVRRPPDLTTETPLVNVDRDVTHLFVFGDWLYYSPGGGNDIYGTLNRVTLARGPGTAYASSNQQPGLSVTFRQVAIAPGLKKAFGVDSNNIAAALALPADGTLQEQIPTYTDIPRRFSGSTVLPVRTFVFPGEQYFANDAGNVFRTSDLLNAGSVGRAFNDLMFLADGTPVVLRTDSLAVLRKETFTEVGRMRLTAGGLRGFVRDNACFVFGLPAAAGGAFSVTRVDLATVPATRSPAVVPAPTDRYSVDDAYLGAGGVVHILSRSLNGLVRWSANTRSFLPTIPLRNAPKIAWHQPEFSRLLLVYGDGQVNELPLGAEPGVERSLGLVSARATHIADMGDHVALHTGSANSSLNVRTVIDAAGATVDVTEWTGGDIGGWHPGLRRLYSQPAYSTGIYYETYTAAGTDILTTAAFGSNYGLKLPLRFSPDGSIAVTGNGRVVNASLVQQGALANDVLDGAWLPNDLFTLRAVDGEAQVQRWSRASYLENGRVTLRGRPVRMFRLSDNELVVVTSTENYAVLTIVGADLTLNRAATSAMTVTSSPVGQTVAYGGTANLAVAVAGGSGPRTYQWRQNGALVTSSSSSTLKLSSFLPANAGVYAATVLDAGDSATSAGAILGVSTTSKVVGPATEVGADIVHPNKNIYDQVLLQGTAATVTADPGQVVRVSFTDLSDDITQVEFSGAGSLSIVLEGASPPAPPKNYNQAGVSYMKGNAGLVITGANETTNVSVFSVGRANAVNQALFKDNVTYDGMADIAFIAIASANGKFGGVRAGNASFVNTRGVVGIYAPGVEFTGPVFVGDLNAFDQGEPMLVFGSVGDIRVTGGDLAQDNGRAVKVKGISRLNFVAGSTSHNVALPAQANRAQLVEDGVDVTTRLVPTP